MLPDVTSKAAWELTEWKLLGEPYAEMVEETAKARSRGIDGLFTMWQAKLECRKKRERGQRLCKYIRMGGIVFGEVEQIGEGMSISRESD